MKTFFPDYCTSLRDFGHLSGYLESESKDHNLTKFFVFVFVSISLLAHIHLLSADCNVCLSRRGGSHGQNTSRVDIIITISIENCTKNMSKICVAFYSIFYTYCYYNVNP